VCLDIAGSTQQPDATLWQLPKLPNELCEVLGMVMPIHSQLGVCPCPLAVVAAEAASCRSQQHCRAQDAPGRLQHASMCVLSII
jgi:hypothetical protein